MNDNISNVDESKNRHQQAQTNVETAYAVEALTGIYIGTVLLFLLVVLILYTIYSYFKRKHALAKQQQVKQEKANKQCEHSANNVEKKSLLVNECSVCANATVPHNSEMEIIIDNQNKNSSNYASEQSSIGYTSNYSRHSSFGRDQPNNQLLNSKVSLILLSSLMSSNESSNGNDNGRSKSISIDETAEIVHKLNSASKLDKQTANQLSNRITKYYENQRKVIRQSSLNETNLSRSKSMNDVTSPDLNILNENKKVHIVDPATAESLQQQTHRRFNSVKNSKSQQYGNYLCAPTIDTKQQTRVKGRRQWKSEKHKKTPYNYRNDAKPLVVRQSSKEQPIVSMANDKPKRPTTIYELYKSNKLHLSNLFDSSLDT